MSYIIKKEGYEHSGVKLGQKCIFEGQDCVIIGFDTSDPDNFIAMGIDRGDYEAIMHSECVDIILDGKEFISYEWVNKEEITLLPFTPSDDSLPTEISPVHVADILEDALEMDMRNPSEQFKIRQIINECIKSLRQQS